VNDSMSCYNELMINKEQRYLSGKEVVRSMTPETSNSFPLDHQGLMYK
jgi:hypothetical protein